MKLKHVFLSCVLFASLGASSLIGVTTASATTRSTLQRSGLTNGQKAALSAIAYPTWLFYDADTDPNTHLPMDNLGLYGAPSGPYTSPTNIGVYFWSVVAARDLGFINRNAALQRVNATLTEVEKLSKWNGFLFSWYDTTNGHRISGPGGTDQEGQSPTGAFISTVDSGWYATGLILIRQVFPELASRATALLNAMNFGIFYDNNDQSTNVSAGQMYGGYNANQGPANFHYGLLYTETRIAAYIGIGTHTMPGEMNNLVIPETVWGTRSFGLNDLRYAQAQIAYAQQTLHYPVWGLSPSSTPDDTGGYDAYGAHALATNANCCPYDETAITPHASFLALDVDPQEAFTNIENLLTHYKIFDRYGFFDAVNPITGQVGHRYLVLDQSMIMAALDNALRGNLMQQHFAQDPVIAAAQPYLAEEQFSIQ